jgi:hypothetical protein
MRQNTQDLASWARRVSFRFVFVFAFIGGNMLQLVWVGAAESFALARQKVVQDPASFDREFLIVNALTGERMVVEPPEPSNRRCDSESNKPRPPRWLPLRSGQQFMPAFGLRSLADPCRPESSAAWSPSATIPPHAHRKFSMTMMFPAVVA